MPKIQKLRLDQLLLSRSLAPDLTKAQYLIMAGLVMVNEQKITKAGTSVPVDAEIRLRQGFTPFVSRGGEKLAGIWAQWQFPIAGLFALDSGISTGGFTDFLLQKGAHRVLGIDVSYGLTDMKIRRDPRVILLERTNARLLTPELLFAAYQKGSPDPALTITSAADLQAQIKLIVMDVSFISVTKILPVLKNLVAEDANYIVLIKPQFEAAKDDVGEGGIIKDLETQNQVLACVEDKLKTDFVLLHKAPAPLKGTKGNQEFFFWLKNKDTAPEG